jgi:large subunit ribosomal protein L3
MDVKATEIPPFPGESDPPMKATLSTILKKILSNIAVTIKRHNFSSQRASHGNSRSHNVPGSISMAQDPGRVFPGKKMTGHMGDETVTTQNLDIVRIDEARQLLLVRGAVPGSKNGHVVVSPAVKVKVKKGAQ